MSLRLDHIGIAVPDLNVARERFEHILGLPPSPVEEVPSEGVRVSFFELEGCRIELLEPTSPTSPIQKFLDQGRAGVHHISIATQSGGLQPLLERLLDGGVEVLRDEGGSTVRPAADGKEALFLHPRSAAGVLLEFTGRPSQEDA